MILGGWVSEQKETKSFVEFQGLWELSEKERFPHYTIAMTWTLGLPSESDKHGVEFKLCYLQEMLFTVSEPQFLPMFYPGQSTPILSCVTQKNIQRLHYPYHVASADLFGLLLTKV